jgi:hypothetical protein
VTAQRFSAYSADMRSMVVILAGALLSAGCTRSTLQVRSLPAAAQPPMASLEPANEPSPAPAPPPPRFPLAVASPLDCAIEAARTSGKPVLVIVTGPEVRAQRGRWLADWMELGSDLDYGTQRFPAAMSLVEIAFATPEQLRDAVPSKFAVHAERCAVGILDVLDPDPKLSIVLHVRNVAELSANSAVHEYASEQDSVEGSIEFALTYSIVRESGPRRRRIAYGNLSRSERPALKRALKERSVREHQLALRGAWWILDDSAVPFRSLREYFAAAQCAAFDKRAPFGARWAQFDGSAWSVQFEPQDDKRDCELLLQRASELNPLRLVADRSDLRDACSGGPCGTGFSGEVSYAFLDQYTRVLVDATDLD